MLTPFENLKGLRNLGIAELLVWNLTNLTRVLSSASFWPDLSGLRTQECIDVTKRTRQGSPESGVLFLVGVWAATDHLLEIWKARECGVRVQGGHLVNLSFVDDMLLFSRSASEALQMFRELEQALSSTKAKLG